MAKPDLYTATQAAKVLGLSVKRVRQIIEEGKLTAYSYGPLKIKQLDVLALRNEREAEGRGPKSDKGAATNTEVLTALQGLQETFTRQLEAVADSNRRNEEFYQAEIQRLRAHNDQLLAAAAKPRGLFRR